MSLLEVCNLSVSYHKGNIVKDVSFSIENGEIVALLGANGSGKTTLMKGICALLDIQGECLLNKANVKNLSSKERAMGISYISQRSSIPFSIWVIDVVLMGFSPTLGIMSNPKEHHRKAAIDALAQVGCEKLATTDFTHLSEGQKQLVILARALVQDTKLLIFDEPDSALDFANRHLIFNEIKRAVGSEKAAILCLHDANIALSFCSRVLLLKDGRLISDLKLKDTPTEILENRLQSIYGNIKLLPWEKGLVMVEG